MTFARSNSAPAEPLLDDAALSAARTPPRRGLLDYTGGNVLQHPCLHELIGVQAGESPEAIALVDGGERITYRTLDEAANRLAHRLRDLGVTREQLVGVCAPRSWRMVAALLAVLKAGGAYVPLDPAYPAHRLRAIAQDAQLPVIIMESKTDGLEIWPAGENEATGPLRPTIFPLDLEWDTLGREPTDTPPNVNHPSDLAYLIYTSGSTGQPKGVALTHQNAVSFIEWAREWYQPEEWDGVLAATSICFDLSIFELFATLNAGGKVILAENALELAGLPAAEEIRLINTVPSVMSELLRARALPESVITVNLAGEPLATALVERLYAHPHVKRVYDLYGPTECTTYSTCALRTSSGPPTIGRAISNTAVYLVDAQLRPVPSGAVGELCIGGEGVARGYLRQPALTAERFVHSRHLPDAGRIYRTGDLARWGEDGSIQYLGRSDHQVKIRGFRIELGEIEEVLRQHPGVRECIVTARPDASGNASLIGYVIGATASDPAALRAHVRERLPDHMVPAAFVALERLPLTPNGKLDRAALPPPPAPRSLPEAETGPRTIAEEIVAELWCEVLERPEVSLHDNFFDSGGNSLLAMRVISRINEGFGVELSFHSFFNGPTVAQLASMAELGMLDQIEAAASDDAR
ncbi:MAG: hypothetical protein RIQ93_1304 [Verrucomicrobiota bacterium]|jgi:amino acid adenylation domain-containing protein